MNVRVHIRGYTLIRYVIVIHAKEKIYTILLNN